MTPERAKVLALTECLMDVPADPTVDTMVRAILAACAEERRAALTEAATVVCCDVAKYGSMEHTCRGNVLALRDREPR